MGKRAIFLALAAQSLPLSDSETVLLICNHQPQSVIMNLFLNQRMGSHNNICLVRSNFFIGSPFFLCCHGASHKDCCFFNVIGLKKPGNGFKMLSCQNLRRSHQSALKTITGRLEQGQHCDNGFSGAHISLNQTVHHQTAFQIPADLLQNLILGFCQAVGQSFYQLIHLGSVAHNKRTPAVLAFFLQPPHCQKKKEKFVKYKTFSCKKELLTAGRKVDMLYCIIIFRQLIFFPERGRQIFPLQLPLLQRLSHSPDNGLISQSLRLSVYGLHGIPDCLIGFRRKNLRLLHGQTSAFFHCSSPEYQKLPHLQSIPQIGHVIPGQLQAARHIFYCSNNYLYIFEPADRRRL